MDKKVSNIIKKAISKHQLEAVILYGSYARGDFTSTSDLDLLGLKAQTEDYTDTGVIDGIQLDLWITSSLSPFNLDENLKRVTWPYLQMKKNM